MGQKINPIIFRLGFNKIWKTEFFEKKHNELPLYIFKDLQIRNYIERFLKIHGIILNDYKQYYKNSTLNLYISYFITLDFLSTEIKEKVIIKTHNKKKVVKYIHHNTKQLNPFFLNEKRNCLEENSLRLYEIKQYFKSMCDADSFLKVSSIQSQKKDHRNFFLDLKLEGIFRETCTVLNLFTNNKSNIIINFCCLNKDLHFLKTTQKKALISLQKFKNTLFFKESIPFLLYITHKSYSASLLAQFIAFQLKRTKRHKYFLSFLNKTLIILLNSSLSQIKGIKIIVKGRLNGVSRAKQKTILIGDLPVQTIDAKLDYIQTTTYNSNGSYGIKIWIIQK